MSFDPETGVLSVPTNQGTYLGNNLNSTVYMHPYEFRGADHIFVQTGENEEQALGVFIFRIASDLVMDKFDDLVAELSRAEFPVIIADEVSDCDWQQFEMTAARAFGQVGMADLDKPWEIHE